MQTYAVAILSRAPAAHPETTGSRGRLDTRRRQGSRAPENIDSRTPAGVALENSDSKRTVRVARQQAVYCLFQHPAEAQSRRRSCVRACIALFAGSALFGQQTQFQGSVPTGVASPTPLSLTLRDAIDRGLKTNLGLLLSGQASEAARGERLRSLSALLPQVTGEVSENVEQIDLPSPRDRLSSPAASLLRQSSARSTIPMRALTPPLASLITASARAIALPKESERAAQLSFKDARDLVVQSVANAYLLVIAGSSRAQALRAQVETDQAIYDRTADQHRAGTTAAIDVLRAHVELQQEQQQLIAQENQVAKDKLALGRVIGLPSGQQLAIADTEPYSPLAAMTPDQALRTAYEQRADFQSAQASVRAAEDSVSAARAERYPNLGVGADYGDVGTTLDEFQWNVHVSSCRQIQYFRRWPNQRRHHSSPGGVEAASG